ncbi:SLATT domain-containing protein [Streptomyces sp. NPDC059788]|uniref:SLATT domain-containing protein n=1 Tax=Streptomyces sp. NPDC059788 TaxID=3346948 RepID=UPI00364A8427
MGDAYPILIAVGVGSLVMLAGVAGGAFLVISVVRNTHLIQRGGDAGFPPGNAVAEAENIRRQTPPPLPLRRFTPQEREMAEMPMRAARQDTTSRVERLIEHKKNIAELRVALRIRRAQTLTRWISGILATVLFFSFIVANVAVGWSAMALANKIAIPVFALSAGTFWAVRTMEERAKKRERANGREGPGRALYAKAARDLKIELEAAEELRLLDAAQLGLPVEDRQYSYKDSIPSELDSLRKDGRKYRRRHNLAQTVIIIGSLGGTSVTALADTPAPLKYWAMGITFAVGAAAGFTGYYKWRERAFYLQQTADDMERHATAFELGIYPYEDPDESIRLAKLAKEIELLRVEQRKREQQLDQPHEGSAEVV